MISELDYSKEVNYFYLVISQDRATCYVFYLESRKLGSQSYRGVLQWPASLEGQC